MSAATSAAASAIPSGESAPVELINATHHGAWIVIATALGLTLGLVCILIRLYVRILITPPLSRDDYIHGAATAFAIIQSIVVFYEVSIGFGTSIELLDPRTVNKLQQAWVSSDILFLIVLYLSKCSLIFLFLRLTPNKIHNKASWAALGLSSVWVIVSAFMIGVNCELNHPWNDIAARCTNMLVRWQIVAAIDIATEVLLVCLAVYLVHDLKMNIMNKAVVIFAFFFRLPLIAFALLRLHYLTRGIRSPNPTLDLVSSVVWAQIELHYSNVAATIPCLRPFMMALNTNYGATEPRTTTGSRVYGSSGASRKGSKNILSSTGRKGNNSSTTENTSGVFRMAKRGASRMNSDAFRSDHRSNNKSMVTHDVRHDSNSIGSNDSMKMIIKKEVDFRVEHGALRDEELGIEPDMSGHPI